MSRIRFSGSVSGMVARAALILGMMLLLFCVTGTGEETYAKAEYTYTITLHAGAQGTVSGKAEEKIENIAYGTYTEIADLNDIRITNGKYYARGFRLTGHDNDEESDKEIYTELAFAVTEDQEWEVAYGVKGAMVAYTVNYVDANGSPLADSRTYYGMPGDKPVVAYRYVDGYFPDAYTLGKTLTEDESSNVFTFTYTQNREENTVITLPGQPGTTTVVTVTAGNAAADAAGGAADTAAGRTAANAGTAGNVDAGNAAADTGGTDIGDNAAPLAEGPQQYADLDDGDTPLAEGSAEGSKIPYLIGAAAGILILAVLAALLLKRRGDQDNS